MMGSTVKGRTPAEVEADVARAVEGLQTLRVAQEALSFERAAAAEERDAWRMAEVDERARSLREEADAARARLLRLYAERARLQIVGADERAAEARAEYDRAHAEYLGAYERVNRLGVEADNAAARAWGLRRSVAENVRQALELERNLPPRLRGADVREP